jgi:hypothetical protein
MGDRRHDAVADAAFDAWRSGRDYDSAWDRAEEAVYQECSPDDYYGSLEVAERATRPRKVEPEPEPEHFDYGDGPEEW